MENLFADAIREAITTERNSFEFYRIAAETVADEGTRRLFEQLAREELEHVNAFLRLYKGDEFGELHSLVKQPYDENHPVNRALLGGVGTDMTEEHALEVSLREEQACIERYTVLMAAIEEPAVREVFAKALAETRNHHEIIKEEYMRVMGMVDRSDQDIYVRE